MVEQLLHIFPGSDGSSGGSLAGGYLLPRNSEVARTSACELENINLEGEDLVDDMDGAL